MKSTADTVIENKAIRRMILSARILVIEEDVDMFNKNPNRKTEKVVKTALSLNSEP